MTLLLECFDAVGWVPGRTDIQAVKSLAPVVPEGFYLGGICGSGLTWSDLQKNRLVEQTPEVPVVVVVVVVVVKVKVMSICIAPVHE